MNILIGIITSILIIVLFSFFEKTRTNVPHYFKLIFVSLLIFCSYLFKPSANFTLWIILLPIFYVVLDDLVSKTFLSFLPFLSFLALLFVHFTYTNILLAGICFLVVLFFSKLTKEKFIAEGESYLVLPFFYLVGSQRLIAFLLISFLCAACVVLFLSFFDSTKKEEYAFAHYFLFGASISFVNWYLGLVIFSLFLLLTFLFIVSLVISIFTRKKRKEKEIDE